MIDKEMTNGQMIRIQSGLSDVGCGGHNSESTIRRRKGFTGCTTCWEKSSGI